MTGNHFYDACRIFRHACAYLDCAKFCQNEPNSIVERYKWYTTPEITNTAFACEIFMKALAFTASDKLPRGHELAKLWEVLTPQDQLGIKNEVYQIEGDMSEELFCEKLASISKAFDAWRYVYEKHGASVELSFLRAFSEALREYSCKKLYKRSWTQYTNQSE